MLIASGPERRIIPIAPLPDGVARATIVSSLLVICHSLRCHWGDYSDCIKQFKFCQFFNSENSAQKSLFTANLPAILL